MNNDLHNMLDGQAEEPGKGLSAQDTNLLREHLRLQQALRDHASFEPITSSEKAKIASSVAATLGFGNLGGSKSTPIKGYLLSGIFGAMLAVGIIFAISSFGNDNRATSNGQAVLLLDNNATTPSLFPYQTPGEGEAYDCAATVSELRDSIRKLKSPPISRKRRPIKRKKSPRKGSNEPVTGD